MLEILIGWIFSIITIAFFIYAVIWNAVSIFEKIKNYRVLKQNWSPENYFKYYCNKYYGIEVPTEADIQLLRNYINELKNKQRSRHTNNLADS